MRIEIMDFMPGRGGFLPGMTDREALGQRIEEINSKYNKKLSELLSEEELYAFKEYRDSERERIPIMGLNRNIFEDDNILDS